MIRVILNIGAVWHNLNMSIEERVKTLTGARCKKVKEIRTCNQPARISLFQIMVMDRIV